MSLGGESSGHVICSDVASTGDGLVAALKVFFAIIGSGQTLQALLSDLTMYPQVMINVRGKKPVDVNQDPAIIAAVADVEQQLAIVAEYYCVHRVLNP